MTALLFTIGGLLLAGLITAAVDRWSRRRSIITGQPEWPVDDERPAQLLNSTWMQAD